MSTILLAVGDAALAGVLRGGLEASGHAVVSVRRPLAVLTEARRTTWDAAIVDDSELGRDTLIVLTGVGKAETPVIGIGLVDLRLRACLALPLDQGALIKAVAVIAHRDTAGLVLRADRRVAQANGREVTLTRIEFRLLEVLQARRPGEVSIAEAMNAVWGVSTGAGTPAPLRGHVRNLRLKLQQIGLGESVRSRRGRGYALAL